MSTAMLWDKKENPGKRHAAAIPNLPNSDNFFMVTSYGILYLNIICTDHVPAAYCISTVTVFACFFPVKREEIADFQGLSGYPGYPTFPVAISASTL